MDKQIIIFSGMPASGKDKLTEYLCSANSKLVAFKKYRSIRTGDTPKNTYYNISTEAFEEMIKNGKFLQYHMRYGRYYGIAEDTMLSYLDSDMYPIIHIGRIDNYYAFTERMAIFEKKYGMKIKVHHILLWETIETLKERIKLRDKTEPEITKRTDAMLEEFNDNIDLLKHNKRPYSYIIKNTDLSVTYNKIINILDGAVMCDNGYNEFILYLNSIQRGEIR